MAEVDQLVEDHQSPRVTHFANHVSERDPRLTAAPRHHFATDLVAWVRLVIQQASQYAIVDYANDVLPKVRRPARKSSLPFQPFLTRLFLCALNQCVLAIHSRGATIFSLVRDGCGPTAYDGLQLGNPFKNPPSLSGSRRPRGRMRLP
jgi:hypothetical protein